MSNHNEMTDRAPEQSPASDVYPDVLSSDQVYAGRLVRVRRDEIRFPGGRAASREVVETADAVAVVALDDQSQVCLLRQYRHPQAGHVWEIPAGRLDVPDEDPLTAAKRELLEEADLAADNWTLLTTAISSPGFATERIYVFLARSVHPATVAGSFKPSIEEQRIHKVFRSLTDVARDICEAKITDAKTIIGILLARERCAARHTN